MKSKKIELTGMPNTRDLGGIINIDGKKIKEGKLFRSGHFKNATKKDIEILKEQYDIKTSIDLRSKEEINEAKDPEDFKVIELAIMKEENVYYGVTRDTKSMVEVMNMVLESKDPLAAYKHMAAVYQILATDEHCLNSYNKFLNYLADEEGNILWHCSMGKDRCGVSTIVLLFALDVDLDTIKEDYLYTNECIYGDHIDLKGHEYYYNAVFEGYFDTFINSIIQKYGSVKEYLEDGIKVDEKLLRRLKDRYLC